MEEKMKVLVTGAAGYIGQFVTKQLLDEGHEVVACDYFADKKVDSRAERMRVNCAYVSNIDETDAIIHLAGEISVGESARDPYLYYHQNIGTLNELLDTARTYDVKNFVFASSAAVYQPWKGGWEAGPDSVYGQTKLAGEWLVKAWAKAHGRQATILRFFNVAGAAHNGSMGENHEPETHLIPRAIRAALTGKAFTVYGDGTQVRDYVHVLDVADACVRAATDYPGDFTGWRLWDVGRGKGVTVNEVLSEIEVVTGKHIDAMHLPEREGDVKYLVANPQGAYRHSLSTIVETAVEWERRRLK